MRIALLKILITIISLILFGASPHALNSAIKKETIKLSGLSEEVEIIKDRWGISHIFAGSEKDLFFAQGFNVARDRLFQLEVWRRKATGTLSEILGEKALKSDIGSRLLKARVELEKEMTHYHPNGKEILTSFVKGINSYIELAEKNPSLLPLEFKIMRFSPGKWTEEVVLSRHNGLFRNASHEIILSKSLNLLGEEKVKKLINFQPFSPQLSPAQGVELGRISEKILEFYNALHSEVKINSEDIEDSSPLKEMKIEPYNPLRLFFPPLIHPLIFWGSNNWVLRGRLTTSGFPMMANDPHRSLQIPSLRYWVHLHAPGWNVVGGGEPALPGVSIGHNEYGAWGLTIFAIDQEDIYIYQTNPSNPNQYLYRGEWEEMEIIRENIPVKGRGNVEVELKFTRHGPVLQEDLKNRLCYALRAAWLEIGGAPYLASLRMDQARNWQEFRKACSFSHTPSENMVWVDREDNIGWQASGITPIRKGWEGLLPVPGDGRFEWEGYLPLLELPHSFNPQEGFIATANEFNVPSGYPHALGFIWSEPYRALRIKEVLNSRKKFSLKEMMSLQHDVLSIPARIIIPLLEPLASEDEITNRALKMLLKWNFLMEKDSPEAAIFASWMRRLSTNFWNLCLPEKKEVLLPLLSMEKMVELLMTPDETFGQNPLLTRDKLLVRSLDEGVKDLITRFGKDMRKWRYGDEKFHHVKIRHSLSAALSDNLQKKLDVGPIARGGSSFTVNMTTNEDNQNAGASFRIIVDLKDWDNTLGTNCPGQSGDPRSPHYSDLFEPWARGEYFPVFFSRKKIESVAESITILKPGG